MPPTKEQVLENIRKAYTEKKLAKFNMGSLPNGVSVEDIALEIKTLTGKDILNTLKQAQINGSVARFPFDKLNKTSNASEPAVVSSNSTVNTSIPEELPQEELVQEQIKPSMGARYKAGFIGQDIEQPQGFDMGDIAQVAGEATGPTIGAGIGALSTAPTWLPTGGYSAYAGGVVGAAAGRAAQTALTSGMQGAPKKSVGELVSEPILAGAEQLAGEGTIKGAGMLANKLGIGKRLLKTGVAALKKGPGIPKDTATTVLRNPESLWNAPTREEAETVFNKWMGKLGSKEERAEAFMGDAAPSPAKIKKFASSMETLHKSGNAYKGALLTAREQIARMLRMGKMGDPEQAGLANFWKRKLKFFDRAIEKESKGYANARNTWNRMENNETFNNLAPLDKIGNPDITKLAAATGAFGMGLKMAGTPLGAGLLVSPSLVSPLAAKTGILGLAAASKTLRLAHKAQLPQSALRILYKSLLDKVTAPKEKEQMLKLIKDRAKESAREKPSINAALQSPTKNGAPLSTPLPYAYVDEEDIDKNVDSILEDPLELF